MALRPIVALLFAGCVLEVPDDDGDTVPVVPDTCDAPEYGDGVCQTVIACEAPDIDCFRFFDEQAEVEGWFADFEATLATEEFREPRAQIPSSDERFGRMRGLLDQAWAKYHEVNRVADLAEHTPALVLIEDPVVNAFVMPDVATERSAFAVIVQTGLFDVGAPDEELLGVVMHELEHAVRLHVIGDTKDRIRRFYVAGDVQPLGSEQEDDPVARSYGEAWRALADEAGPYSDTSLRGLPFGPSSLGRIFDLVVNAVAQGYPGPCGEPAAAYFALEEEIKASRDPLDRTLPDPGADRIAAVLDDLDQQCITGPGTDYLTLVAQISGVSVEDFAASLSAEDLALVDGRSFVDGTGALLRDRRGQMRDVEAAFADEVGRPWTSLRFFSYEEAADDAPAPVLDALGLPADGAGQFLLHVLDPVTRDLCSELLDQGETPPYGVDLQDEHHATCWRVDNVRKGVAAGAAPNARIGKASRVAESPWSRVLPPRLADRVVY